MVNTLVMGLRRKEVFEVSLNNMAAEIRESDKGIWDAYQSEGTVHAKV